MNHRIARLGILAFALLLSVRFVLRRNGGGGGVVGSAELEAALNRRAEGRAAVVIVRVEDEEPTSAAAKATTTRYLVQRKSADYPIEAFRNAACLFGGNAKPEDATPIETLTRELGEELPPDLARSILSPSGGLRLVSASTNAQSAEILGKTEPYAFLCACYEARITADQLPPSVKGTEGGYALLTREQLLQEERYAWGYDRVISSYFGEDVSHFCDGVTVTRIGNNQLKDWTPPE